MSTHLETAQLFAYRIASQVPVPGPADAPQELKDKASAILGFVFWGVGALAVVAVMAAAAAMFFAHRNGTASEHGKTIGMIALGCALASGASGFVNFLM
ncbi:hypothetical protein [Sanguibacter suarezii]|uniref:hypothetical protein n=1 Tax=Sanguibacter suarezii TaxID=60921 RepID=UPI000835B2F5|nr:hypothetical protein [Sanguibacter suarezii]